MSFYEKLRQYAPALRVIICTSVEVEHKAVETRLSALEDGSGIIYGANDIFSIGMFAGLPVIHIRAGSAGATVMELLADLRARLEELALQRHHLVIVPGILAGLHPASEAGNQNSGDIVVASAILPLTLRHEPEGMAFSHQTLNVDKLAQSAQRIAKAWNKDSHNSVNVHCGLVAGGYGLIKNDVVSKQLREINTYYNQKKIKILAVEMESDAYAVLARNLDQQTDRGDVLLLFAKAISDWGDAAKNDLNQIEAAKNSVDFVHYCLEHDIASSNNVGLSRAEIKTALSNVRERNHITVSNVPGQDRHGADTTIDIKRIGNANDNNTVEYWINRFTEDSTAAIWMLIINGPSGRGKTYFAEQISNSLKTLQSLHSLHIWWDCGNGPFTPATIGPLLVPYLPDSVSPPDFTSATTFASDEIVTQWLSQQLHHPDCPIIYLYLDDLDRYQSTLGDSKSPLNAFLSNFLTAEGKLRIVATSRNSDLDTLIMSAVNISKSRIAETGNSATKDSLRPFTLEESRRYLETRLVSTSRKQVNDVEPYLHVFGGEPLTLSLFADACNQHGETDETLDSALAAGKQAWDKARNDTEPQRKMKASQAVRNALFRTRFQNLEHADKALGLALRAVAFLTDERFPITELYYSDTLPTEITRRVGALVRRIDPNIALPDDWLESLKGKYKDKAKGYLREGKGYLREDDIPRIDFDDFAAFLLRTGSSVDINTWHKETASVYEQEKLFSLAAWHQMQAGDRETAFWTVVTHTFAWERNERWQELFRLYFRLRELFWHEASWQTAFLQIKAADILYTAFDSADKTAQLNRGQVEGIPDQNEWQLNVSGVVALEGEIDSFEDFLENCPDALTDMALRVLQDAYLRALLLKAIHAFESYDGIDDSALKPGSKGERQNEAIVIVVNVAIRVLRNFKKHPAREAILYNFRGCFHNGGGHFDLAIKDYIQAAEILNTYKTTIDATYKKIIEYSGKEKDSEFWQELDELQKGFDDDLLDVANNWARSRLLLFGPAAALDGSSWLDVSRPESTRPELIAIAKFEALVERLWEDKSSARDRHTFAYALINLVYLKLTEAKYSDAWKWLGRSYRDNKRPIARPESDPVDMQKKRDAARRVRDRWTEAYFDVLEAATKFYRSFTVESGKTSDGARAGEEYLNALEEGGQRFNYENFGFSRDEMIIQCNIPLVRIMLAPPEERAALVPEFLASVERPIRLETGKDGVKQRTIIDEPVIGDFLCYLDNVSGVTVAPNNRTPEEKAEATKRTKMRFPAHLGDDQPKFHEEGYRLPLLLRGPLQMINVAHSPHPLALHPEVRKAIEGVQ